jgi:hypothetical protein
LHAKLCQNSQRVATLHTWFKTFFTLCLCVYQYSVHFVLSVQQKCSNSRWKGFKCPAFISIPSNTNFLLKSSIINGTKKVAISWPPQLGSLILLSKKDIDKQLENIEKSDKGHSIKGITNKDSDKWRRWSLLICYHPITILKHF